MARKAKATPPTDEVPEEGPDSSSDRPLLDLSDAAIKTLIHCAKMRGYVTNDQISALSRQLSSEQIEDVLAMFSEMGVNLVETEEASEEADEREGADEEPEAEGGELMGAKQK